MKSGKYTNYMFFAFFFIMWYPIYRIEGVDVKTKLTNGIIVLEFLILVGISIYIFADVKSDKNMEDIPKQEEKTNNEEKNFSLKTNEILLEINKQYNLLNYVNLENMELSDLNILYDKHYVSLDNNQFLIKENVSETKIKFNYKDIEHELIINIENDLGKCSYEYDGILNDYAINNKGVSLYDKDCDNFVINYNDIKMYFSDRKNSIYGSNSYSLNIYNDGKKTITLNDIDAKELFVSELEELYLIEIYSVAPQCAMPNFIILFDRKGNILRNTSYVVEDDLKDYNNLYDFKRINFDYDNNKIIEEFSQCGTFSPGGATKYQKIYEYKDNSLVLLEKKIITH